MKHTTLYLIRHGETEWNRLKKVQGHQDTFLNETGLEQAQLLAEELKDTSFHAVYASPLQRAFQTAQHLSSNIQTDDRLKEFYYGIFEGFTWADFHVQIGEKLKEREGLNLQEKRHFKFHESTESYFELYTRAKACLDELVLKHPGEQIAVVTHGGLIKSLLSYFEERDPRNIEVDNVGYVILQAHKTEYRPIRYCRIKMEKS